MQIHDPGPSPPTVLGRALDWWGHSRARWARLNEIDYLSPDEIAWLAEDVGLGRDEFVRVVHKPDGTAGLLARRLAALGLDADEILKLSPQLLGDLQRTCAGCPEKGRCADDMSDDPTAPGWESYCANAGTLRTLT